MASPAPPKAFLFDVFGTCVNWRYTVTRALEAQSHVALNSPTASLASRVRLKASSMTMADWGDFAQQWRNSYKAFTRKMATDPTAPWKSIDEHHLDSLRELLDEWELAGLWSDEEVRGLSLVWHRLDPWADSASGIALLNRVSSTATLSNGNVSLLDDLNAYAKLHFTHVFSAEVFGSYKPSPKVYLGAVERLGLRPGDCAMVAAHLDDLKAAKSHGLQTVYVERPGEESWAPEDVKKAKGEGWVDLWVDHSGNRGFVTVAEKFGAGAPSEAF